MKALVTGATGFIGRHLIERLVRDHWVVRALVRDGSCRSSFSGHVEVVSGDVRDPCAMKAAATGVDKVFHLAGRVHALSEVHGEEEVYHSVNVEGTRNLLEAAIAGHASGMVFISSVKAIGDESPFCLDESVDPSPRTEYGRSKLQAERLLFDLGARSGVHVTALRLPLVYGPGNKGNLFRMISAIDRGFFPPFPEMNNHRSVVHVTNVVDAAVLAATKPAANGQCYIVTDTRAYSTRELYEIVCRGLGKQIPRWHVPVWMLKALGYLGDVIGLARGRHFFFDSDALEKLIGSAWFSSEKISRELGYRPAVTFQDALPELISRYRASQA